MPQRKSNKVSVTERHGKQDIETLRKEFEKTNYAKAMDILKRMRDPARSTSATIQSLDRERIREYLQAPGGNEVGLRNVNKNGNQCRQ